MNDAANRSGSRSVARATRRAQPSAPAIEEELETGEPIEDEDTPHPPARKIKARATPFDGRAPQRGPEATEPAEAPAGQMVLTTAKYLPKQPEADSRRSSKGRANQCANTTGQESGGLPGGKWGGVLAMVVAVLWLLGGLANDVLYFYPPVLFVIGLGAFMKDGKRGA